MLGDENNNDLIDLTSIDRAKCALLVIDELGDPREARSSRCSCLPSSRRPSSRRPPAPSVCPSSSPTTPTSPALIASWPCGAPTASPEPPRPKRRPCSILEPTDYVVEKRRYSGFFQTGLLLLLNELDVDTLICCGMDTNICVKHTVADAYFNNFNIIVVGDATATFLVGNQEEGLEYMKVCYAAKVVDTNEAVKLIEG